jgi:hypothetical protein
MKVLNVILILALAALTGACATVDPAQNEPVERFNSAYIHAVEEAARNQAGGLDVIWINPPAAKDKPTDPDGN